MSESHEKRYLVRVRVRVRVRAGLGLEVELYLVMPQKKTCMMSTVESFTTSRRRCSEAKWVEKMPVLVLYFLASVAPSPRRCSTSAITPCGPREGA